MSIRKITPAYPDLGQTFTPNISALKQIDGLFLMDSAITIPIETDLLSFDYWFNDLFEAGLIIPLHGVQSFAINDEDLVTKISLQDFTYEVKKGKYRHSLTFLWSLEFHQLVESLSGTNLTVVYYDTDHNLILTTGFKGLSISGLQLKKYEFANSSKAAQSVLNIELKDVSEFNNRGIIKQVDWNPEYIDRLFVQVSTNATSTQLIAAVTYNGNPVTTLLSSNFTVTDDANGALTFTIFTAGAGVYTISGFSGLLTGGCVSLISTVYIGRREYIVEVASTYSTWQLFDLDNFVMFSGDNFEFFNTLN